MKKKSILRHKNKTLCRKGLLLVFLFIAFLFPTWVEGQAKKAFINNPPGINLRTRSTTKGSSIITRLPYGAQVEVLEEGRSEFDPKYKYYRVRTANGQVGWVYAGDQDDWLVDTLTNEIQVITETKEGSELQDTPVKTMVQSGHSDDIESLAFNKDGSLLASLGSDNVIKIWRISDGRLIKAWENSENGQLVTFNSDGHLITVGPGNMSFWELSSARLIKKIEGDFGSQNVVLSLDGSIAASVSENRQMIKVWQVLTGKPFKTLKILGDQIFAITLSPDGRLLAATVVGDKRGWSQSETLVIWRISDGSVIKMLKLGKSEYTTNASVAFSPDGRFLAFIKCESFLGTNSIVRIWRVSDWNLVKTGECSRCTSVSFSPDGNILTYTSSPMGGDFDDLKLWRVSDWSLLEEIGIGFILTKRSFNILRDENIPNDILEKLKPLENQKVITEEDFLNAVKEQIGQEQTIQYKTLILKHAKIGAFGWSFAFSPDGRLLALGGGGSKGSGVFFQGYTIELWSLDRKTVVKTLGEHGLWIESLAFSPDGRYLAFAEELEDYGKLKLCRVSDGKLIWEKESDLRIYSVAFSPDGQFLASKGHDENLWQIPDGKLIRRIEPYGSYYHYDIAFSPDGQFVASGARGNDGKEVINLWRISDGTLVKTFKGDFWHVFSIAFSPDGRLLASGSSDLKLWNISDGSLIKILNTYSTHKVSFSPDGRFLISLGLVRKPLKESDLKTHYGVKIWRVADGQPVNTLEGHTDFAFSPDGRFFASRTGEHVMFWNVSDGTLVRTFKFPGDKIVFSHDGRLLAGIVHENTIELWETAKANLLATLFPFPNSNVVLTPEGFFSGSGDFNKYVHFVKGLSVYDFNQFYDAFYRPDLVEKKLQGENISKEAGKLSIEEALKNPPPHVAILSPEDDQHIDQRQVTVKVKISDMGGKIGDIRLYHNGKLVRSSGVYRLAKDKEAQQPVKLVYADEGGFYSMTRGTTLRRVMLDEEDTEATEFVPQIGTVDTTYEVTLVNGENTLSVAAFNGENTIMSALETITVTAEIPSQSPDLFVLAVGNNDFKDSSQNLTMAVKDATDFSKKVKEAASLLYDHVHVTTLRDATKPEVFHAIHTISTKMNPEDVFILFVATHGIAQDDLYYLFTSEFDGVKRKENTISSMELMELSKTIPALKQVLVLDTCHAGGIETVVAGLYDARISVLAKALGMHIFAGAKTFQEALDEYKENGLFTYYILKGLKGEADADRNKEVSVVEMNPYLSRTVKEASQGRQEPLIRNFGEDLPVVKVGGE